MTARGGKPPRPAAAAAAITGAETQNHLHFRALIRASAWVALFTHVGLLVLFIWVQAPVMAWINVISVAMHARAVHLSAPGRNLSAATAWLGIEVLLHALVATAVLGWETGFHYLMIPTVPIVVLSGGLSTRAKWLVVALITTVYLVQDSALRQFPPLHVLPMAVVRGLHAMNVVTMFVISAALSLHYSRIVQQAQRRLHDMASTDPLTGAWNRRRLLEWAALEVGRRERHGGALSVILCDIDHFKRVNDTHGHDAGDLVLRHVCHEITRTCRDLDAVCRWGGEEFLIAAPATEAQGARVLAERIRERVAHAPAQAGASTIPVTLSLGVATLGEQEAFDHAVARADAALYRGKAAGRNQVMMSDETPASGA